tara:strand:- start:488 stop:2959 length:2472 start_codon:yes stop_codon:yes gene_type:complete
MARAAYGLQIYRVIPLESANGTTYTARIWTTYSGGSSEYKLASNGLKLDWESADVQDKNSPILASKLTLDVLVENLTQENEVNGFSERAERDVWVTLNVGSTGSLLWSGYLIPNLDIREDVSYPYVSTLVFVDGIASLKETPFLRETNSSTGATPTFPYVKADTFANAGYRRIIGSSTAWITEILNDTGMVLESDEASAGAGLENYVIQTAVNWWNEDMGIGPQSAQCPLSQIKLNMSDFYKSSEDNEYQPPNTYSVLLSICRAFNMRFFYWEHTFHFIQVSEYNTNEQGVAPYTTPINIPTREFFYNGGLRTDRNYFGSQNYSLYNQVIETGTSAGGLQKLATTQYESLPAIKRTKTTYAEMAGGNFFNGFPLFLTHNTVSGLPTAWPTDNALHQYTQFSQSGQEYNIISMTDANLLAGFLCRIFLSFTNTSNADLYFCSLWTIRAKPSTSAWGDSDNMTLYKFTSGAASQLKWMTNEFPLLNNQQYVRNTRIIPAGCNDHSINMFDSATDSITNLTDNLIPTDDAFEGNWDFQFYTFTEYDNDRTRPMKAYVQGNSAYSHGLIYNNNSLNGGTNYAGTALEWGYTPTFYAFDYEDTITNLPNGNSYFESMFVPVKTGGISFGNSGQEVEVQQSGNNSYEYDVGVTMFGDGSGADTNSTMQVYDGANWVYVNPLGKWAKGIYTWNGSVYVWSSLTYDTKIQVLLGEEILSNQSKTILTFNGTTALSSVDKYFSGSTKLKFVNPCARIEDSDGKKYMMMRSSFNLINDEWNGQWVQVYYNDPTTTNGTRNWKTGALEIGINSSSFNTPFFNPSDPTGSASFNP